ncbi:MAG: hypothetical protein ACREBB_04855 [Nitrosotalea sp.]
MSLHVTYDLLCGSILGLNKNVESVAVVNNRGRVIEKISRPKFARQFPDHLSELFCMHYILQVSMGRDFDENYGPVNYHMSERTSFTTLTFPIDDNIVLVTTNKNTSPITLARKITCIIDEHRKQLS